MKKKKNHQFKKNPYLNKLILINLNKINYLQRMKIQNNNQIAVVLKIEEKVSKAVKRVHRKKIPH